MRRIGKVMEILALSALVSLATVGCKGGKEDGPGEASEVKVTGVSISPNNSKIKVGETVALTATVSPNNAGDKRVTWTSGNESVATVSQSGVVTGVSAGLVAITATSMDGGKTGTASVTVEPGGSVPSTISVTGVTLEKTELTLEEGKTEMLVAKVSPDDATNKKVTWSSSDASVAKVDDNGTVTAVKAGSATITVTTVDGGKTATCKVTVTAKSFSVESVTLDKTSVTLEVGGKVQLTATVLPAEATNKNVTWSTSDKNVVTLAPIGPTATLTAQKEGTATVTVTTADGGKTATCTVSVTKKGGGTIEGHAYVEMGVKTSGGKVLKWATMNVGATKPEQYGDYFAWGETAAKTDYSWSTYFDNPSGDGKTFTKYAKGKKTVLDLDDDAARQIWKGTWRIPTDAEWTALRNADNFKWTWTDNYEGTGVAGRIVTSKVSGYEGNSIFLPAAGLRYGTSLRYAGSGGDYWSSSLYEDNSGYAGRVLFDSGGVGRSSYDRYDGLSVRPVSE